MQSPLSGLPKWKLDRKEDDIRGWPLRNAEGRNLGTVGELIVDTDTRCVTTIVTLDSKRYPAHDVRVGDHVLTLETPQARAVAMNPPGETAPAMRGLGVADTVKEAVTTAKQNVAPKKEALAGDGAIRAAPGGSDEDLVVPVVDEELDVDTRRIEAGGKRVLSHIVTEPVTRDVSLREERVAVERRAVDRPLEPAEAEACFRDADVEMHAKAEQAVIGKRARVVEEVVLKKTMTEREQRVRDTVRHTEAAITKLNGSASMKGAER